jgi:ribosomal protein S27AE
MNDEKIVNDWEECPICGNEVYVNDDDIWICDTCGWVEPVEYET